MMLDTSPGPRYPMGMGRIVVTVRLGEEQLDQLARYSDHRPATVFRLLAGRDALERGPYAGEPVEVHAPCHRVNVAIGSELAAVYARRRGLHTGPSYLLGLLRDATEGGVGVQARAQAGEQAASRHDTKGFLPETGLQSRPEEPEHRARLMEMVQRQAALEREERRVWILAQRQARTRPTLLIQRSASLSGTRARTKLRELRDAGVRTVDSTVFARAVRAPTRAGAEATMVAGAQVRRGRLVACSPGHHALQELVNIMLREVAHDLRRAEMWGTVARTDLTTRDGRCAILQLRVELPAIQL